MKIQRTANNNTESGGSRVRFPLPPLSVNRSECHKKCTQIIEITGDTQLKLGAISARWLQNRRDVIASFGYDRWAKIRAPWVKLLHALMWIEGRGILETAHKMARWAVDECLIGQAEIILAMAVEEIEMEGGAV